MLKGNDIILRAIDLDDAPQLLELRVDFEGQQAMLGYPLPVNLENEKEWIMKLYPQGERKHIYLAIEEKESGRFIGYLSARNIDYINRNSEFGIILKREFRGKGRAVDAMMTFFKYLFFDLNLHKIKLEVLEESQSVVKMYERMGFKKEGLLERHVWQGGKYKNLLVMSLFSEEFTL